MQLVQNLTKQKIYSRKPNNSLSIGIALLIDKSSINNRTSHEYMDKMHMSTITQLRLMIIIGSRKKYSNDSDISLISLFDVYFN